MFSRALTPTRGHGGSSHFEAKLPGAPSVDDEAGAPSVDDEAGDFLSEAHASAKGRSLFNFRTDPSRDGFRSDTLHPVEPTREGMTHEGSTGRRTRL